MQQKGWRIAARYGVPFGVGAAFVGSLNGIAQAYRHAVGPSAQGLVLLTYLWLLATAICVVLAAQMSARTSGSLRVGVWAGAITSMLCLTIVFAIFVFSPVLQQQLSDPNTRDLPLAETVLTTVVILLFFSVVGGLLGALVAVPGAWLGREQARIEWLNALSLPEQSLTHDELAVPSRAPLDALDDETFMAMVEASEGSSDDIVINPSWIKSLLMFLLTLTFVVIGLAMTRSSESAVWGWLCVGFAGLLTPLAPVNMAINRPLLRFTADGIAYKGAYSFWRRGFVSWGDVGALVYSQAPSTLFGCKELSIFFDGVRPWRATFQNWQLPFSTRKKLREAVIRFHRQIEENEIVVSGIE
jgi:hypothetical protein